MEIRVSVRQLVEFILRSGDIDNRRTGGSDTAMQEGSRIHRLIQRRMGSDYHAEVPLKYTWNTERYDIIVEGRADGIIDFEWERHSMQQEIDINGAMNEKILPVIDDERKVVIDEIKGTYKELRRITKPIPVLQSGNRGNQIFS